MNEILTLSRIVEELGGGDPNKLYTQVALRMEKDYPDVWAELVGAYSADESLAAQFLCASNPHLSNRSPLQVLSNDEGKGSELVSSLVSKVKHGS